MKTAIGSFIQSLYISVKRFANKPSSPLRLIIKLKERAFLHTKQEMIYDRAIWHQGGINTKRRRISIWKWQAHRQSHICMCAPWKRTRTLQENHSPNWKPSHLITLHIPFLLIDSVCLVFGKSVNKPISMMNSGSQADNGHRSVFGVNPWRGGKVKLVVPIDQYIRRFHTLKTTFHTFFSHFCASLTTASCRVTDHLFPSFTPYLKARSFKNDHSLPSDAVGFLSPPQITECSL